MKQQIENLVRNFIKEELQEKEEERPDLFNNIGIISKGGKYGDYSFAVVSIVETNLGTERRLKRDHPHALSLNLTPKNVPVVVAERLKKYIEDYLIKNKLDWFSKIEIVGDGFINFFLSEKYINQKLNEILENEGFGKNDLYRTSRRRTRARRGASP